MTMKIKETIYGDKDKKTTIVRDLDAEIAEAGVTIPDNFYLDVVYNLIAPISGKNSKSRKNLLQGICKNKPFWACKWDTMWVNKEYGNVETDHDLKLAWATYIDFFVNCREENADNVYRDFDRRINNTSTYFYSFYPRFDDRVKHSDDTHHLELLEYAMSQIGKENKQDDLISQLKVKNEKKDFLDSALYNKPWWLDVDYLATRHFMREDVPDEDVKKAAIGNAIAMWGHPVKTDKMTLYTYIDKMMYKDYVKTGVVEANKKD